MQLFQKARLKLTGWYLLIIMAVSFFLSAFIYNLQVRELERLENRWRLRTEQRLEERLAPVPLPLREPGNFPPALPPDTEFLAETKRRLALSLASLNGIILLVAGGLGYFLSGKTLKPIEEMVCEQNRFIGDASHELRTPLTSLKSTLEVYLRNPRPTLKKAKRLAEESLEEVNKLQVLTESLLNLSSHQENSDKNFILISITEIAKKAVKRIKPKAEVKRIKVKTELQEFKVLGDEESLTSLLVILLDNAIKYSAEGSEVFLRAVKRDGKGLILVQDHGEGIRPEDKPHIFDRFYRADSARSKAGNDGYGLGLAIAKETAKKHRGKISVESELGKGSTFTVQLPLSKEKSSQA
ncbi:HAMP domain-containing histidine kinase [Candidatus Shapirobacteria bacterium]|nr:HAMP domain-containing histidine kinase [Candidatus Shapirobacteria bacterium]